MGNYRLIVKNSVLPHGVKVRLELPVPDVYSDENAASAMGRCASEKNEGIEKFVEEIWAPQYFRHAQQILKSFEKSRLPIKFVKGQKWLLTPLWSQTDQMRSVYDLWEDMVIEDIDTTLMPLGETAFGCCIGGKILAVKDSESVNRTLCDARSIIPMNEEGIKFVLSHATGNVVNNNSQGNLLMEIMSEEVAERFEQLMLKLAWSV